MSEGTSQPANQPKRLRSAQGTRRTGSKQTQQATAASPPTQEASAPLAAPDTTGSAAPQALPAAKAAVQPASDEPSLGECWGEFPTKERQAELKQRLEAWERDHTTLPFAKFKLTGADVYWLATYTASVGDLSGRTKVLDKQPQLESYNLQLEGADLREAQLEGANLKGAQLKGASLGEAHLKGAFLAWAHLEGANLAWARLEGANLSEVHLEGASLNWAHLEGADLWRSRLEGADLKGAHLEGADLREAYLIKQVNLREATCDVKTLLAESNLDATIQVAVVVWNGVPLMRIAWKQMPRLGDEAFAHQAHTSEGKRKDPSQRLEEYEAAARAYRQLAIVLHDQGITEAAERFTYRALVMQRKGLWWQLRSRKASMLGPYLFSLFLAVLTGYGFRLWRILVAYALLVAAFALAYWSVGIQQPHDLSYWQALAVSITAFHGRVFSSPFTKDGLDSAQIWVTALEAICGLVIEGGFIAMLTQRFFNR